MVPAIKSWELALVALYFFLCGVSAVCAPELWYWAAGIPPRPTGMEFIVLGEMMLALAFGAAVAATNPTGNLTMISTLIVANVLDALGSAVFLFQRALPALHGVVFIIVCSIQIVLLVRARRYAHERV